MQPKIISIQISDGTEIIPTVTMIVATQTVTADALDGETINHAILRALAKTFGKKFARQTITLVSCGANLGHQGFKAYAHIQVGVNEDSQMHQRKAEHGNMHMAIARAIFNCLQDIKT